MSLLMVEEWVSYNTLKTTLKKTDGNLASHIKLLRKHEYVEEKKTFLNRKPHTTYRATKEGRLAFTDHLDALEQIIKGVEDK